MRRTVHRPSIERALSGGNIQQVSYEVEVGTSWAMGPFARRGDSGSMVLNVEKDRIGMVTSFTGFGTACFVPVRDLVDDIESVTGGRITLP